MYMNMQTTKALLVTGKRLRKRIVQDSGKLEVKTDNAEIENVVNHTCKLLCMIIDEDLTYEVHVDELCNKRSKRLGLFCHISPYLKKNQRIIYFNATIKPLMIIIFKPSMDIVQQRGTRERSPHPETGRTYYS